MSTNILAWLPSVIFVGILFVFSCCASHHLSEKINNVDKSGKKTGAWVELEGDPKMEQLLVFCHYRNGVRHGAFRAYYLEGPLATKGKFKNGYQVGKWVGYLENGTVSWRQVYAQNGELISNWGLNLAW